MNLDEYNESNAHRTNKTKIGAKYLQIIYLTIYYVTNYLLNFLLYTTILSFLNYIKIKLRECFNTFFLLPLLNALLFLMKISKN